MATIFITFLYIVFVLAAIVLVVVVLLQEGKGGGLSGALGTHGQETFGAGARGINTFTGVTAAVFLCTAIGITVMHRLHSGASVLDAGNSAPAGSEAPVLPGGQPGGPPTGAEPPPGSADQPKENG